MDDTEPWGIDGPNLYWYGQANPSTGIDIFGEVWYSPFHWNPNGWLGTDVSKEAHDAARRLMDGEDPGPGREKTDGNWYNRDLKESLSDPATHGGTHNKHIDHHNKNLKPKSQNRIDEHGNVEPKKQQQCP
jgi:hypothetical protein